ncbi:MAG TPA: DinB family protein [Gemmatimonadales bacterium]|nr:DinB family protein [Gemmatimonadales bacterium]
MDHITDAEDHLMNRSLAVALTLALTGGALPAQTNAISADLKRDYQSIRGYFLRAAEEMPDSQYTFKPSPDVRTFAQQMAHVADDQYNLCSPARNEVRQAAYTDIENRLSTKTDLLAALKQAFAYCDAAYDALSDASGAQMVTFGKGQRSRFGMLNWNLWHTWEHYGNVVVYLRMKGFVPPTSQRTAMTMPMD